MLTRGRADVLMTGRKVTCEILLLFVNKEIIASVISVRKREDKRNKTESGIIKKYQLPKKKTHTQTTPLYNQSWSPTNSPHINKKSLPFSAPLLTPPGPSSFVGYIHPIFIPSIHAFNHQSNADPQSSQNPNHSSVFS